MAPTAMQILTGRVMRWLNVPVRELVQTIAILACAVRALLSLLGRISPWSVYRFER
jgi:hypothetical protein